MSELAVPRTPTPGPKVASVSDVLTPDAKYTSPPPVSSSDLTPPPSTQHPKHTSRLGSRDMTRTQHPLPSSPPPTTKTSPTSNYSVWNGPVPTVDQARELPETQLRDLVCDLLPALVEARMVAAHAKLQHSLLSIETAEAAQRAAVEHEMTRREVEVLQAGSPVLRNRVSPFPDATSPSAQIQCMLDLALKRGRQLEAENLKLQHRLKKAKKIIKHAEGKNMQLTEDNQLLRLRIKQNREHLDAMKSSVSQPVDSTPRPTHGNSYREKESQQQSSTVGSQNAFDALLFAGQVLNGEPASVPSTPTHPRPMKFNLGHIRGTHSLSSLPTTPERMRPMTADNASYTPVNQIIPTSHVSFSAPATQIVSRSEARRREDRDSTISASEDEAYTDDDVPASQASQAASSMLRRYPGPARDVSPSPGSRQEKLVQAKLLGRLTKPGVSGFNHQSRRGDEGSESNKDGRSIKRMKLDQGTGERLGLGIAVWPSPSR